MSFLESLRAITLPIITASVSRLSALTGFDVEGFTNEVKKEVRALVPDFLMAAEASGVEADQRRQVVRDELGHWFDEHVKDVPGPDALVKPAIRSAVLALGDECIDYAQVIIAKYKELHTKPADGSATA